MRRPLFWTGMVFLSVTAAFLRLSPPAAAAAGAAIAALAALFSGARPKTAVLAFGGASAAALVWLLLWQGVLGWWMAPVADRAVQVQMTVESVQQSGRLYLCLGCATASSDGASRTFDASLSAFENLGAAPGEVISCMAQTQPAPVSLQDISARPVLQYVSALPSPGARVPHPWFSALLRLRAALSRAAADLGRGEASGVLAALLTGDRSMLSADVRSSLQKSGLSHLVVVSGLHLSMLSQLVLSLLAPFGRPRLSGLLCIAFCWGFALLTGLGSSVVRAAVMLTLSHAASLSGRQGDTLTSLAVAGVLMALISPAAVVSPGFLLSFGSVAGIAALAGPIRRALESIPGAIGGLVGRVAAPLSVTVAAQTGAAPALIALYGTVSPLGIPANLIAVGLIEPAMLLGLCGVVLGAILPPVGALVGRICSVLIEALLAAARLTASLPFSQAGLTERYQAAWLVGFFLLLIALCSRRPPRRLAVQALLSMLALLLSAECLSLTLRRNTVEAVLFPYQNAVAVVRGGRAVLIGAPAGHRQAQDMAEALTRLGVRNLDCIIAGDPADAASPVATVAAALDCTRFAAPDTPAVRAFCRAAGLTLSSVQTPAPLLGGVVFCADGEDYSLTFGGVAVYQSGGEYAIMGANAPPLLSVGEDIARYRFQVGGTP